MHALCLRRLSLEANLVVEFAHQRDYDEDTCLGYKFSRKAINSAIGVKTSQLHAGLDDLSWNYLLG